MSTTMNIKLLNVTKTTAQWADVETAGTIISKGLLCVELDTNDKSWVKIGDGVHTWANLPYITDAAIASLGNFLRIKGTVASYEDLPADVPVGTNTPGDVYFVGDATQTGSDIFEEYVWTTGGKWEFIGKTGEVVIPAYTGGTGISVVDGADSKVINHTNSITAQATATIMKIKYDAQGHLVTGTTAAQSSDFVDLIPIASSSTMGGFKVGNNLTINSSTGVLDATDTTYALSGAYGTGNDTWVTTLTPSTGSATTSTVPKASTSVYGITTLTDSTSSTSTTTAATPNSVKSAYDLADSKSIVSVSGTTTGTAIATITIDGTGTNINVPTTGITSSSATTGVVELSADTKYSLSAGGSSVVFKTPAGAVYEFADSYDAQTNKGATVATVTNAINALDGSITGTAGNTKTLTAFSQTDGVVSATFGDIAFPVTDVTVGGSTAVTSGVAALGAAAGKGVTDNSTATAVTSSDTNLITGRTLYYAGYIKDISINGTSGTTFTGIAKSATINGGSTINADASTGNIALTGLTTGLSYTNTSGTTSTINPDNSGNLDLTSLILNCTL